MNNVAGRGRYGAVIFAAIFSIKKTPVGTVAFNEIK